MLILPPERTSRNACGCAKCRKDSIFLDYPLAKLGNPRFSNDASRLPSSARNSRFPTPSHCRGMLTSFSFPWQESPATQSSPTLALTSAPPHCLACSRPHSLRRSISLDAILKYRALRNLLRKSPRQVAAKNIFCCRRAKKFLGPGFATRSAERVPRKTFRFLTQERPALLLRGIRSLCSLHPLGRNRTYITSSARMRPIH